MLRALMATGLTVFTSCLAFAQTEAQPSFEVASVKPAAPQPMGRIMVGMRGGPGSGDPGQINYSYVSLRNLVMNAYDVKGYQVSGPGWLDSERFDVVAKIPPNTTKEQFKLMLQNLLAERFKLTLHHETKESPMYALVVAKGGSKMKESVDDTSTTDTGGPKEGSGPGSGGASAAPPPPPPPDGGIGKVTIGKDGMPKFPAGMGRQGTMMMVMNGRFRMVANKQSMSRFVDVLANQLDRPVVDMTELKANYDFTLDYTPEEGQMPMAKMGIALPPPPPGAHEGGMPGAPAPDNEPGLNLFSALQQQLGLKLEPRKGPVDLLVIDHVEKAPTEN